MWGLRRRIRGPWGVPVRCCVARALWVGPSPRCGGVPLQLRVVVLTLGLSAAVILVLGFVLTSQITNRVLDVKVRAATEEIDRARNTVGGIVSGEEARSLDSSLQLARNTLISKTGQTSGTGLAGTFDAVLVVPGDGPRAATAAGPVDQIPRSLRDFVKAGQVSYQYSTVRTEGSPVQPC